MTNRFPPRPASPPQIAVIGDLILDQYTWGNTTRISPEAPIPVLQADQDEVRPGGAASVAAQVAALGADVRLIGTTGSDREGRLLSTVLQEQQIASTWVLECDDRPTTSKHRLIGRANGRHPHQIVRVDRESTESLPRRQEADLFRTIQEAIRWASVVLLSDYGKGVCTDRIILNSICLCREAGVPILVDPSRHRNLGEYAGASLLKPNRSEAAACLGRNLASFDSYAEAANELLMKVNDVGRVVVTLDSDGIAIADRESSAHLKVKQRDVYDITGAGDSVLAVLGFGFAAGWTLQESSELANLAAGRQVQKWGTTPVTWAEIESDYSQEAASSDAKLLNAAAAQRKITEARERGHKVVFTNGCFDLFHVGHLRTLEAASALGDMLIVAVNSDRSVQKLKGSGRPFVPEHERAAVVAALDCVDGAIIFDEDTPHKLLELLRPDILVKGGTTGVVAGHEVVIGYGGAVVRTDVFCDVSTTKRSESISGKYTANATGT